MKFRHEYKHCINMSDYYMITSKLKHIAKLDTNAGSGGEYRIRSLYFDNYNDKILNEKVSYPKELTRFCGMMPHRG